MASIPTTLGKVSTPIIEVVQPKIEEILPSASPISTPTPTPSDEISTVVASVAPKTIKPVVISTPQEDTTWMGTEDALEQLKTDPYSDPTIAIETPDAFVDDVTLAQEYISNSSNVVCVNCNSIQDNDTTKHYQPLVRNYEHVGYLCTDCLSKAITDVDPTVLQGVSASANIDNDNKSQHVVSDSEPKVTFIPDTAPQYTPDDESTISNVDEDRKNEFDQQEILPGMETIITDDSLELDLNFIAHETENTPSTNPYTSKDEVLLAEVDELLVSVQSPTEELSQNVETTSRQSTDDIEGFEEEEPNTELPVIKSYEPYRTPTKETIVPLQAEELILQVAELFVEGDAVIQKKKMAASADARTFPGHVSRSQLFLSNTQTEMSNSMRNATGTLSNTTTVDGKKVGDALSNRKNASKHIKDGTTLSGNNAVKTAMALICGMRQVVLLNSGFSVIIRPPLLNELHHYYLQCRFNESEFGRSFGALSYIPADIEIKKAAMQLFVDVIMDHNLANINNKQDLLRHINILDYDTCLWGMASLMFADGTEVEMFCNNRDCGHTDVAKIQISQMRFNDYDRMSQDAIRFAYQSGKDHLRTTEDLERYRTELFPQQDTIRLNDSWYIHLSVPSVSKVISEGEDYLAEMMSKIQLSKPFDVADYLRTKYYRLFTPWIEKISFRSESGEFVHFSDPLKLPEIIEALQLDSDNIKLTEQLHEFIHKHRVSHFGYLYTQCPHCKKVSDLLVNGIIPCDMQYSFFTLTMDRIS